MFSLLIETNRKFVKLLHDFTQKSSHTWHKHWFDKFFFHFKLTRGFQEKIPSVRLRRRRIEVAERQAESSFEVSLIGYGPQCDARGIWFKRGFPLLSVTNRYLLLAVEPWLSHTIVTSLSTAWLLHKGAAIFVRTLGLIRDLFSSPLGVRGMIVTKLKCLQRS